MKFGKSFTAVFMSLVMALTMMPAAVFAEETDDTAAAITEDSEVTADSSSDGSEEGSAEISLSIGTDPGKKIRGADPEQLMDEYFLSSDAEPGGIYAPKAPLSVKGDRLTGNDLKYYKYYKTIIKEVNSGKRTATTKKVSLRKFLGKRRFTAKELGVKRIGYKKNGKWYVSKAAEKKIVNLLAPENWQRVYQALIADMSSECFWADWYTKYQFIGYKGSYRFTPDSVTFDKNDWIEFRLAVMPEFAKSRNADAKYIYRIDKNRINDAEKARSNARHVVETFDNNITTAFAGLKPEELDYLRMWYYCMVISDLSTYDHYTAELDDKDRYWMGPWSMISVFDYDPNTSAVCAGYARAFKYLCDLSDFESDWIDCQIVTGSAGGVNGSHMWNIVRMNDGLNYVVDPTWIDGDDGEEPDGTWFLRGAPYGSADWFYLGDNYRVYDSWTKAAFASAERILSGNEYYELSSDREIVLKGTKIKKTAGRKKAISVSWVKAASPLGALYVDGYQIQYSTNRKFSNAKQVTVKGYAKTSKTIKNLKRKKRYYVRIRTFAKAGRHTYYSKWSGIRRVRTR